MLTIDYTNYKGERKNYNIEPLSINYHPNNPYHGAAWCLYAQIVETKEFRHFALTDIHNPDVLTIVDFRNTYD